MSETSRVVAWLTEDQGRIATLIKGSLRPKSAFLGQYDLFYTCEVLFYLREQASPHILKECAPLNPRPWLREQWKSAAAASYFCDLTLRATQADTPLDGYFTLLETALDALQIEGSREALVYWFELKLLDWLGLAPRLQHCTDCGRELAPGTGGTVFSFVRGGVRCGSCAGERTAAGSRIPADTLATMIGWQRSQQPRAALRTQTRVRHTEEIRSFLGDFLAYHLDSPPRTRTALFDVLDRVLPAPPRSPGTQPSIIKT